MKLFEMKNEINFTFAGEKIIHQNKISDMKILSNTEHSVSFFKTAHAPRIFSLKGDVFAVDAHAIQFNFCTPFFIRN